jgi:hypothetical protein
VILLAIAGALYRWSARQSAEVLETPTDAYPPGRWSRVPPAAERAAGEPTGEDLARVLSLPYLEGKVEASGESGVVRFDPSRTQPGLNLYCSGHAPEAILMDLEGRALHRWRLPFKAAFPSQPITQHSAFFRRVALLPDGELLALFHAGGLVRLDRDSRLLWAAPLAAFNDLFVEDDGRILLLTKEARVIPEINPGAPVLEDAIVELSPEGEVLGSSSLLAAFRRPPWNELLAGMADRGDILHSNTVTRLPAGASGPFPDRGLLVSLREVDVVGVLDPKGSEVVWGRRGAWRRQHEPVLLGDGNLLLFDNQGGAGGSARVLEIDPETAEAVWSWGEAPEQAIFSPEGGTVARLANGNTLITASESGRVVEIDAAGEIVWEYRSPHRAGPRGELVATLWEMQRLAPDAAPWLESD